MFTACPLGGRPAGASSYCEEHVVSVFLRLAICSFCWPSSAMSESWSIPFTCPSCRAAYRIQAMEAPRETYTAKLGCGFCGARFPSFEGSISLKYEVVEVGNKK